MKSSCGVASGADAFWFRNLVDVSGAEAAVCVASVTVYVSIEPVRGRVPSCRPSSCSCFETTLGQLRDYSGAFERLYGDNFGPHQGTLVGA